MGGAGVEGRTAYSTGVQQRPTYSHSPGRPPTPIARVRTRPRNRAPGPAHRRGSAPHAAADATRSHRHRTAPLPGARRPRRGRSRHQQPDRQRDQVEYPDAAVRIVVDNGRISVTDHGPGIADENLPHIFERFYRAPAARGMPGAGLGLAIVAGVAHADSGKVNIHRLRRLDVHPRVRSPRPAKRCARLDRPARSYNAGRHRPRRLSLNPWTGRADDVGVQ